MVKGAEWTFHQDDTEMPKSTRKRSQYFQPSGRINEKHMRLPFTPPAAAVVSKTP